MKAYVCDKCGRVVTDKSAMKKMTRFDIATDNIGKYDEVHLCDYCKNETFEYIRSCDESEGSNGN